MMPNASPPVKTIQMRTYAPSGTFIGPQVEHITLPKWKGYEDIPVVGNKFTRWMVAY